MIQRLLRTLLPALLLAGCTTQAAEPVRTAALPASGPGTVSAADPRAAAAGVEILRAGGSATDAAIAVMLALTVVEPQSSGIGGGSFLVHHDAGSGAVASYDGRETAPAAAGPDWFYVNGQPLGRGAAVPGGRSVGVPGNFRLAALAHSKHGRLTWDRLFAPAIRLARDGFAITPRLERSIQSNADGIVLSPWGRAQFLDASGKAKPAGTVLRNPELATLLERVAQRGPDWFYTGPPAADIVRTVNTAPVNPSRMTAGDLASYDAKERPPVCGSYRGHRVCGMGPPSSGATTVFAILKQLERFDLAALGPDSPEAWHLLADSMRLAYADREAWLADPDYVQVPVAGLMDEAYLRGRSALITEGRALADAKPGTPAGAPKLGIGRAAEVPQTSHFVAVDARGNVASMTSTIEGPFGSGLTSNGFFLNNELTDFSIVPQANGAPVANRVEGGKRPRSSMSPTIVYAPDGSVRLAVGAAGGSTIIAQVAKAIIGVIDWKLSAQDALALPQILGLGNRVLVERGTRLEAMVPALTAMGHSVGTTPPGFKANAVERVGGRWVGAADPRSEGVALSE